MTRNLVRDWMTPQPITVEPKATLALVYQILTDHRIRRVPVVDGEHLVGIVTLGDIREYKPSEATTLSVFDMAYVLAHLTAEQVMTHPLITVTPTMTLIEVARLMYAHKIGGMPVMADNHLVGIITESDVFRAMLQQSAVRQMPIRDWMTPTVIAIGSKAHLADAHQLMTVHKVRRLPVVDDGRLVGIVTAGDLRGAQSSPASSPNLFELHYLMSELTIDRIMTPAPFTVDPSDTLQTAADTMRAHKISGLPVMAHDQLVGIITESDMFRALLQALEPPAQETSTRYAWPHA